MHLQTYSWRGTVMVCISDKEVEKAKQDKVEDPSLPYSAIEWIPLNWKASLPYGSWIWTGEKWA
jgi:hypothetical protein